MSCGIRFGILLLISVVAATPGAAIATTIIYVDDDAASANDGSSWPNAYRFLQDALADANASPKPLEIRVAQGTYRPDEDSLHPDGTGNREATLQLISGVSIKGGYAGFGEPDSDARDVNLYETILSGNIGIQHHNSDNSYHIFYHPEELNLNPTAILDGCTLTAGAAYGFPNSGAGMYNQKNNPTIMNCRFSDNRAEWSGGGMHNDRSSPRVLHCTFENNYAKYGGGMFNESGSPTVEACIFRKNWASTQGGGGMANWASSPTVKTCIFNSNTAYKSGGGMFNYSPGTPLVENCTFTANSSRDCGGGMYNGYGSNSIVTNCSFAANSARNYGGGMFNTLAYPIVSDCILWADEPSEISNNATVTYTDIQGGWPGAGNINVDPLFVDVLGGNLHLHADSPCVNAGNPSFVVGADDVDMDGEKRVMLGRVDMGADEFNPFLAEFVVVRKERVGRTVFEYDCQIVLENISRFAVSDISLEMAEWSENMTIIQPSLTFGDAEIGPGESITSVDTCTFTVDRSEAIDQAEIIWRVTAELADTGAKMEQTVLTPLPPDQQTGFDGLKEIAENWLWQGAAGGIDEDSVQDGTVNLADFANLAEQWKKK